VGSVTRPYRPAGQSIRTVPRLGIGMERYTAAVRDIGLCCKLSSTRKGGNCLLLVAVDDL
jgi:hypothetical protein